MRIATLLLIVILCSSVGADPASAGGRLQVGPAGGGVLTAGDLRHLALRGFAYGLVCDYSPGGRLGYGLTALYIPFDKRDYSGLTVDVQIVQVAAHAKYFFNPAESGLRLFLEGGAGVYLESADLEGSAYSWWEGGSYRVDESDSSTEIGVHAGPGFQLRMNDRFEFLFGADFHLIFDAGEGMDNSTYVSGVLGVLYSFGGG